MFMDKITNKDEGMFILHTDPVDENGTDLYAVIKELAPNCNIKFTMELYHLNEISFFYLVFNMSFRFPFYYDIYDLDF